MKIQGKIAFWGIIAATVMSAIAAGISFYTLYRLDIQEIKDASIQRAVAIPNIEKHGYEYQFVVVNSGNRNLTLLSCIITYGKPNTSMQIYSPSIDPVSVPPRSSIIVPVELPKQFKFAKETKLPVAKTSSMCLRFHATWPDGERVKADICPDKIDWENLFNIQFRTEVVRFVKNTELKR